MIPYTRIVIKPHPKEKPWHIVASSGYRSLNHLLYQMAYYESLWPSCEIRLYPCDINFPEQLHKTQLWDEAMTYDEYMEYLE